MASIRITQFGGLVPDLAARIKPETHASIAHNCLLEDGTLRPQAKWVRQNSYDAGVEPVVRSIAYDPSVDRAAMYSTYDTVLSPGEPFPNDIAYGADLSPPVSKHVTNQGLTKTTVSVYNFGVTAEVTYTPGNLSAKPINRVYAISRVRYVGGRREEGGLAALAGLPSDIVHEGDIATIEITVTPLDDGVTHVRVYRTLSGLDTGDNVQNELDTHWHLIAEIPLNGGTETTFIDGGAIATDALDVNFSQQFHPPTITARFFGLTESGWFVAVSTNGQIQISERYLPHAWPSENNLDVQENVTDVAIHGDNVYIGTEGVPYIVSISQGEKGVQAAAVPYKEHYPCEPGSMTASASGAIYASTSGLIALSREGMQVITGELVNPGDKFYTRSVSAEDSPTEEAQKIYAAFGGTNHGVYYKGKYYGFCGPLRADMFYLTTELYSGTFYLTTEEYPDVTEPVLWTVGENVAQKNAGAPNIFADYDSDGRRPVAHRNTGRVFVPAADGSGVWIYTSGAPADPIAAPLFIPFVFTTPNEMLYGQAIDQDLGTYAITGGNNDAVLLIFDDNSTQTITFANVDPKLIVSLGAGKFAVWCEDDGFVYIYGPSNSYAAPLVTSLTPVFIAYAICADIEGNKVFLSTQDTADIRIVSTVTGIVTSINTGNRWGYRLVYNSGLNLLAMDNHNTGGLLSDGNVYLISPNTGIEFTVDLSDAIPPEWGASPAPDGFRDMAMADNTLLVVQKFEEDSPSTGEYIVAIVIDMITGGIVNTYVGALLPLENLRFVTPNATHNLFYISANNENYVVTMQSVAPYSHDFITDMIESDNTWTEWV